LRVGLPDPAPGGRRAVHRGVPEQRQGPLPGRPGREDRRPGLREHHPAAHPGARHRAAARGGPPGAPAPRPRLTQRSVADGGSTGLGQLPVRPPLRPMLARRANALPAGEGWVFEPKWDGFRVLVFRAGDAWLLQSRDERPLDRYFPELRAPLAAALPARCVLDGELVVAAGGGLDFEALQQRIHPAASRIARLARETPASIVFFDLLAEGGRDLRPRPFRERRRALEALLAGARP